MQGLSRPQAALGASQGLSSEVSCASGVLQQPRIWERGHLFPLIRDGQALHQQEDWAERHALCLGWNWHLGFDHDKLCASSWFDILVPFSSSH